MFEKLREAWHKETTPFDGFMAELCNIWQSNVGLEVLLARQSWQQIPTHIIQQGLALQARAKSNAEINQAK